VPWKAWRTSSVTSRKVVSSAPSRHPARSQAFQGTHLDTGTASNAEQWAYSISWIGLGLALLAFGILGRSQLARFASLALMFLAVGKVFLYDMAALQDFYRILSFLGLGASLMLLAGLYQRFVFRAETDGHASS
jgi:uncharacterized membrane protein